MRPILALCSSFCLSLALIAPAAGQGCPPIR